MEKKIIVHIGLPKTGTTFLQSKVFPFLNFYYIGTSGEDSDHFPLYQELYRCSYYYNNPIHKDENFINFSKNKLWQYIKDNNKLNSNNYLFSFESLVGATMCDFAFQDENIEMIKNLFPNSKIFFVFRLQHNYAESVYNQMFKGNKHFTRGDLDFGYMSLNKLSGYKAEKFSENNIYLNIYKLDWYELYKKYCDNFGQENVFALPYEMFKETPEKFLQKFYEFFDIEPFYPKTYEYVNSRSKVMTYKPFKLFSSIYTKILKLFPLFLRRKIIKKDKAIRDFLYFYEKTKSLESQKFSPAQKELLLKIHAKNNKKLAEILKIDLSQYGYF